MAINVGDFDIAQFAWVGDAFALCCLNQIFTTGAQSNFGKISSPAIDAKVEEVLAKNGVKAGYIRLTDRGALDYAIEARIETALQRARAA